MNCFISVQDWRLMRSLDLCCLLLDQLCITSTTTVTLQHHFASRISLCWCWWSWEETIPILSFQSGLVCQTRWLPAASWVNLMYHQWGEIDWFPSREDTTYFGDPDFIATFPSARMTLDGTKSPIQKPHEPLLQQATFSTYKNKDTVKVMVGTTPRGLVSYVSPV